MPDPWPLALQGILQSEPCVMVTVAGIKGSAPRELGARMLVTASGIVGSVGGGNLERQAQQAAVKLLAEGEGQVQFSDRFGLGPALNQCCGGAVTILYEYCHSPRAPWLVAAADSLASGSPASLLSAIDSPLVNKWVFGPGLECHLPPDFVAANATQTGRRKPPEAARHIVTETASYLLEDLQQPRLDLYLFGAGHVGKAIVRTLHSLPFRVHWIDSRNHEFPQQELPQVSRKISADPVAEVAACAPGGLYLVMTHSHELDEDICHAILARGDFNWLGLIGSETKSLRFRHRLAKRGIAPALLERLTCPIGLAGVKGKRPATIAIAVAAQLMAEQVPDGWK